jgi:Flp pilus assembly CpaE family ATPase
MAKMRAKTIAVVPLIERVFGIAFSDGRPVLQTRLVRKLAASIRHLHCKNMIGI